MQKSNVKIVIQINLSNSKDSLKTCFRRLLYEHLASTCTTAVDRFDLCRHCGETGHIECDKDPKCLLKSLGDFRAVTYHIG